MQELRFPKITPQMILSLADKPDGYMDVIEDTNGNRILVVYKNGAPKGFKLSKWDNAKMWAKRILGLKTL